jgi:Plasmid pRiA4b ORF-3-like protein.
MSDQGQRASTVYQIRCYLQHLRPIVWRCILIRKDASIEQLHQVICCLYGFGKSYPYQFHAAKVWYKVGSDDQENDQESDDEDLEFYPRSSRQVEIVDEKTVPIESLVTAVKDKNRAMGETSSFITKVLTTTGNCLSTDRLYCPLWDTGA